jgi:hypothetical protein
MSHLISTQEELEESTAAKTAARKAAAAAKVWRFAGQFANGQLVANYLNAAPPQGAGEAIVTGVASGPYVVWVFF